ncbi:MAG: molybdenum ABC transporter permease subunit [Campylobacteraceae bacterium 4484_4]|nr:MAG: molybdenum ABC transporter permease subunit [Campylobacteraceae bacterium 4484_4]
MMETEFWTTMLLTFRLAAVTTLILLVVGIPLAYLLSTMRSRLKPVLETIVSMPLVLPPTVLGFYLLVAFSPEHAFGKFFIDHFDFHLAFSFEGLVLGSVLFSLPFMVHPIQTGFQSLPPSLAEAAQTLGKSRMNILFKVLLPNIKPSLLTGTVIAFAHTVGEFGVVLMIGGNIPGKTKVASIAIYDEVEALNYDLANHYAFTLFLITFVILLTVYMINRKFFRSL